ncbi:hypothetical protein V6Z11_D04G062000 [Gossypium hirsutum]
MANPSSTTLSFSHPLYLHPSDMPSMVLVSHQLTDTDNYCVWSRSMCIALLAKNKLGFIDGSCSRDGFNTDLKPYWDRCNALELSAGIVFTSNAAIVWKDLQEMYDKVDGSRIYYLHRAISTHTHGTSSPLPTVNQAYSLVMRDETQRELASLLPIFEATALLSQQSSTSSAPKKRSDLICSYCRKKGHIRAECYHLTGFPADFNINRS